MRCRRSSRSTSSARTASRLTTRRRGSCASLSAGWLTAPPATTGRPSRSTSPRACAKAPRRVASKSGSAGLHATPEPAPVTLAQRHAVSVEPLEHELRRPARLAEQVPGPGERDRAGPFALGYDDRLRTLVGGAVEREAVADADEAALSFELGGRSGIRGAEEAPARLVEVALDAGGVDGNGLGADGRGILASRPR